MMTSRFHIILCAAAFILPAMPARAKKPLRPLADARAQKAQGGSPIEIRGVRSISNHQALSLIDNRIAFVKGRPPTPALADDAAFILKLLLENHGFEDPEVTPSIEGGKIILNVKEGRRLWLGSVRIKGVPEEDAIRMSKLFSSTSEKRRVEEVGEKNPPFLESDVATGLDMILADFRSRGFWSAKADILKRGTDPATGEVKFVVQTVPGPLHTIGSAVFNGPTQGLDSPLRQAAAVYQDLPATTANINGLRADVEKVFTTRGYTKVSISMAMDTKSETKRLHPVFTIHPGIRYRRGGFEIDGIRRTRPEAIHRFGQGIEGDDEYYNEEDMTRRINALLSTGAFSAVQFDTKPRGDFLDATLHVEEGEARGASFYGGFGTYEGPIFGASYYDRNFQGRLWNFTSGFEITGRTLLGNIGMAAPWIDSHGSRLSGRFFAMSRSNEGYDKFETGFAAQFVRQLAKDAPFTLSAGLSWVSISSTGIPMLDLGDDTYVHAFLSARQDYDRRDNPVMPTKGWNVYGLAELGLAQGNENTTYLKIEGGAAYYLPVAEVHRVAFGLRAGNIFTAGAQLPIDLRYFLGGADSVRSFPEREMPPRTKYNFPRGGESYWVANIEYLHQIVGPLKAVAFLDGGGLSESSSGFGFDDVNFAAGLGLRLDLPIGPVRFEYGHNLTRDLGEPSGTFHFSIGLAF